MFSKKGIYFIILPFICLLIASFFTYTQMQGDSFKESMNHSLKTIYPDLGEAVEAVSITFLEEKLETISSSEKNHLHFNMAQHSGLGDKIEEILATPHLEGALAGVSVRDGETGELLFSHQGDVRLRPASNMKLLTGIAALEVLGPDYQFETELLIDGEIKDKILNGDLYIKGKGDPTLLKKDFNDFAQDLKRQGIEEITGDIIGDDTWYDDVRYSPDLPWTDQYNYVGAAISALTISPNYNFNASSVIVRVLPGDEIGDEPVVEMLPENDYLIIDNQAETARKGSASSLSIDRNHGTNELVIQGTIPMNSGIEVLRSVWEPPYYALHVLRDSLLENDITLADDTELLRGAVSEGSESLAIRYSVSLKELMRPFMKLSNNTLGEIFLKEMGKVVYQQGSWPAGLRVMGNELAKYGVPLQNFSLRDGSGMSYRNLIPPDDLTELLYEVQAAEWFDIFLHSQPVSGNADPMIGGTLSNRLGDSSTKGKVRAKTGTLSGVSTLSGYLTTEEEKELIFSIMFNNQIDGWMPGIQDEIVKVLAEYNFDS